MKRKDWFYVVLVLLICIVLDQITKRWAMGLSTDINYGFIKLILAYNRGAMLGLFSDLPVRLAVVTLSTSGIFILCFYAFIQYIIPDRLLILRIGLSVLVGGILGNVLDRIFYGYVIDFISVQFAGWQSPIWNVADATQWIGYILLVYSLIKYGEILWPDKNVRTGFWINKKFQIKHSLLFTSIGLFLTLISIVFSYTYLKVSIEELSGGNILIVNKFMQPFLFTFLALSIIFALILFSVGKLISHRIAGPLYAFERFLKEILDGKGLTKSGAALKLRTNDDFKHLEELAEQIKQKINRLQSEKIVQISEYKEEN